MNSTRVTSGNLGLDGADNNGWVVGHFLPNGHIRRSEAVEIKWRHHPAGEARADWVVGETRSTLSVLIHGQFRIDFAEGPVVLSETGDYALWHSGAEHRWEALSDSLVMTVRWPSITGYGNEKTDLI